jgi:PEP-CTERM motif
MIARSHLSRPLLLALSGLLFTLGHAIFTPIFADSLTVSGGSFISGTPEPPGPCTNNGATVTSGAVTMTCPSYTVEGATFTEVATGDLSTGTFGVSSDLVFSGAISIGSGAVSSALAQVDYLFSVPAVETGTADFSIAISGDTTCTSCLQAFGVVRPSPGETITLTGTSPGTILPPNGNLLLASGTTTTAVIATPITDGVAELTFLFDTQAQCNITCTSTADYLDPLSITGATVDDADGNLVSGATLVSESGFNPNSVPTPEPSSLLLLGIGMAALVVVSRRRVLAA